MLERLHRWLEDISNPLHVYCRAAAFVDWYEKAWSRFFRKSGTKTKIEILREIERRRRKKDAKEDI